MLPLGDDQYSCGGTVRLRAVLRPDVGRAEVDHPPGAGRQGLRHDRRHRLSVDPGRRLLPVLRRQPPATRPRATTATTSGQWHVVALNTAPCADQRADVRGGFARRTSGCKQDLAANTDVLHPGLLPEPAVRLDRRWRRRRRMQPIWQDLYDGGVDVVLNGDSHWYERFAPHERRGSSRHQLRGPRVHRGHRRAGPRHAGRPAADQPGDRRLHTRRSSGCRCTTGRYGWTLRARRGHVHRLGHDELPRRSPGLRTRPHPPRRSPAPARRAAGWYPGNIQVSLAADGQSRRLRHRPRPTTRPTAARRRRRAPSTPARSRWRVPPR